MPDPGRGGSQPTPTSPAHASHQGRYVVRVRRAEIIDFAISASDDQDAENRYLFDGDEIGSSRLEEHRVLSIHRDADEGTRPPLDQEPRPTS